MCVRPGKEISICIKLSDVAEHLIALSNCLNNLYGLGGGDFAKKIESITELLYNIGIPATYAGKLVDDGNGFVHEIILCDITFRVESGNKILKTLMWGENP